MHNSQSYKKMFYKIGEKSIICIKKHPFDIFPKIPIKNAYFQLESSGIIALKALTYVPPGPELISRKFV